MVELITGDLLRAPRAVGKPLQRELEGRWAARRGSYRVLYAIDDKAGVVTVLAAEHRRDVYRRR
ncbi:MAG: type II toxin-antitoxin system RelE family toxin [Solirubrobacteraceae bacterium]